MKSDSKIREGFHSIEILLKNKPEVIKKVIVPEAREDARMLKLLQACSDNDVAVERSKKIKKNPQAIVSSMDIGDLKDLKNYLENLSKIKKVAETIHNSHIVDHYYLSHLKINPFGIIPIGVQNLM